MTSRDRLRRTLNHEPPDRVCVDFGATFVTGFAASALARLRRAVLGDASPVRVTEPYQMLGEVDDALRDALGIDVVGLSPPRTMFGFRNEGWKPFALHDGTPVLVPEKFVVTPDPRGGWLIYPEGDTSVPPSGYMPAEGFYFDAICRQEPIREDALDPADNTEEFAPLGEADLRHYAAEAERAARTGRGVVFVVPGTGFGDIALVPGAWMKRTKGIRGIEEWYVSTASRRGYVRRVFERQCEIALANLDRLIPLLGDSVDVAFITGTDFGTQRGPFISPTAYRDLYKPFHRAVNDVIHRRTGWKTFIHSCGSVVKFIPDFIDAGFDILNPVQCSAAGMEARDLKREFGRQLVFWGGGVDTQKTLAFGTPEEVYREVRERIAIFGEGGGFVFNAIHNVQAPTPLDNLQALFRAVRDSAAR